MTLRPYLILMRPANLVTAVADILAGASMAGLALNTINSHNLWLVGFLIIATICLYGGGVVLNDVFDFEIDKKERPERPLPSNQVSRRNAVYLAIFLFLTGIVCSLQVSLLSGIIALAIALFATVYDKWAKHFTFWGPLVMGLCRGLNLLLGMSFILEGIETYWPLAGLPVIFVAAITLTSQGEVRGNNKQSIVLAMVLDALLAVCLLILAFNHIISLIDMLLFLVIWWGMNIVAKFRAIRKNQPKFIMQAVKIGVISLIPLNACYAAGFSSWGMGIIILCLLPVSLFLAKFFAVT